MYSRMLIPLDGSKVAEQVLPYARYLAKALNLSIELFQAVDAAALEVLANPAQGRYVDTLLNEKRASSAEYLETVGSVRNGSGEFCSGNRQAGGFDS